MKDKNISESLEPQYTSENSVEDSESKENETQIYSGEEEFIQFENTSTYEYELANNIITVDGIPYNIATNEMDYYGGYMFYYIGNSNMERHTIRF